MNMKLLFIISNNEEKISNFINYFKLPFNALTLAYGTATRNMLDFFGLKNTEKYVAVSIFSENMEKDIFKKIKTSLQLQKVGNGIAFSVPLSSTSKYINDSFNNKRGDIMEKDDDKKYHLIVTIVQEGYSDKVMTVARKYGANGGTLIKGRGIGDKNSFKFFNMTLEPEKDIVLIVSSTEDKNKIMEGILEKNGIKTEAKGFCFSIPIDNQLGIDM